MDLKRIELKKELIEECKTAGMSDKGNKAALIARIKEAKSVVEETPTAEETPAIEETPTAEGTQAVEETPAADEAPAVEEA